MIKRGKKAAFEMSMSTIIVIVLSISFLIIGLILIRNIYGVSTKSIGELDSNLMSQMKDLFPDDNTKIIISLTDQTAKIRAGTENFGVGIAGKTRYANDVGGREKMQYTLSLDTDSTGNCVSKNGLLIVQRWFEQRLSTATNKTFNNVDKFDGDTGFARLILNVPTGIKTCNQKVFIDFYDKSDPSSDPNSPVAGSYFIVQILRKSLF